MKTLLVALGLSVLLNVIALTRVSRTVPAAVPAGATHTVERITTTAEPSDRLDAVLAELGRLRREIAALKAEPAGHVASSNADQAVAGPPTFDDELAQVIADQDRWDSLLTDLGKFSAARRQELLAEEKHLRAVLDATADVLGLHEPQRATFVAAAGVALGDVDRARRDLEQAMRAEPRPTREQSQELLAAYRGRQTAAQDRLVAVLDLQQPAQKQFAAQIASWFRATGSAPGWRGWGSADRP